MKKNRKISFAIFCFLLSGYNKFRPKIHTKNFQQITQKIFKNFHKKSVEIHKII